jgi:hypothetical protein
MELDQLQLKGVRDFYNNAVRVMDKYEVLKTYHKLFMLMVCKNQDVLYAQLIPDKLKLNSPNFDWHAMMCVRSRDLPEAGIKDAGIRRRYNFLLSNVMICSAGNAGTVVKYAGTMARMQEVQREVARGRKSESKGSNARSEGSNMTCNF